ncbi:MAG: class I adenylate-forming enzyme family protein [Planctomycetota bacterium]
MIATSIAALLDRAATLWPSRVVAVDGAREVTCGELRDAVECAAGALRSAGVDFGDRVLAICDNSYAYLVAHFALARIGAILVPINTRLLGSEVEVIRAHADAKTTIADRDHAPICPGPWLDVESLASATASPKERIADARVHADHPAQLYFTSGTTGQPKGVILTHGNVVAHAVATIAELGLSARDTWAHVAPMFHLADAWASFAITAVGGRHVFLRRFDAEACANLLVRERVTITNLVPTMLTRMLALPSIEKRDFGAFRRVLSGGAPIAPETVRRIRDVFRCEYVQTYGLTETSPYLTMSLPDPEDDALDDEQRLARASRTGRAVLGVQLRVVDDQQRPVATDDHSVGEIEVRGPTITPGYWNDPAATAAAFTEDGYFRTGDLATIDARGSVRIVDRKKDVIKSGGESVFSTEVEYRLYEHPAVLEAAVFGEPDADLGERVVAAVVLRSGLHVEERELIAFCRQSLAAFKSPRRIRFLDALPKTGSGKIQKRMLRVAPS